MKVNYNAWWFPFVLMAAGLGGLALAAGIFEWISEHSLSKIFLGALSIISILGMLGIMGRVLMPDEPPLTLKFWGNTLAVAAIIGIILWGLKSCMERPSRGGWRDGIDGEASDRDPFGR